MTAARTFMVRTGAAVATRAGRAGRTDIWPKAEADVVAVRQSAGNCAMETDGVMLSVAQRAKTAPVLALPALVARASNMRSAMLWWISGRKEKGEAKVREAQSMEGEALIIKR